MRRQRFSRELWYSWLEEQPRTGLSIAAFCRDKGISQNSFYVWRRKLAGEVSNGQPAAEFVPVAVIGSSEIMIDLPCGATVRFARDETTTRQILSVLLDPGLDR